MKPASGGCIPRRRKRTGVVIERGTPFPDSPSAINFLSSEHDDQVALFAWRDVVKRQQRPRLKSLFAIPNGEARPFKWYKRADGTWGKWSPSGKRLKLEGQRAGVADVHLPAPFGGWSGVWLELKKPGESATKDQREFLFEMWELGHFCAVCWGWLEAKDWLERYDDGELAREDFSGPVRMRAP